MPVGTPNIKKFYVGQPATTSTLLYTAPANSANQASPFGTAVIKDIYLANTTSSAQTITIGIGGVAAAQQLVPNQTIAANTVVPITALNKVLSGGDTIYALQSSATAITVHIDGIEVQ
jgi:hypothetical protein